MKKLIGIILAVCMLCTVAFAGVTGTADKAEDGSMKILVTYAGIADGAQATLLAYEVTGVADATAATAYVDEDTTPIVGIDQEVVDSSFEIKLADDFLDDVKPGESRVIVVKVGGTDIAAPASWLVTFDVEAEGPAEVTVTVLYGDVNGDGAVGAADASLILQKAGSVITFFTNKVNGSVIPDTVGDVNGDGAVGAADASLVLQKAGSIISGFTSKVTGEPLIEYTYTYVPEA